MSTFVKLVTAVIGLLTAVIVWNTELLTWGQGTAPAGGSPVECVWDGSYDACGTG